MSLPVYLSLTSYGRRLEEVHHSIQSILNNTMKPNKILLTVYKDDVEKALNNNTLIDWIEKDIVTLLIAPENLKNHLKYWYAMRSFSDYPLITVDDDVEYPKNLVIKLYDAWKTNPSMVSACGIKEADFNKPINDWILRPVSDSHAPSLNLYAEGIDGVIYPPHFGNFLSPWMSIIKNKEELLKNDDLVLHWIKHKNNIKTAQVKPHNRKNIKSVLSKEETSWKENHFGGRSQKAINTLMHIYKI